jgi:hypothetical protein
MHAPLWMASLPVLNATIFEGVFAKNIFLTQGRAGAGEDEQPRLPSIPVIPGHNKTVCVCCLFWPPVPQLLVAWLAFAIWPVVQPTPFLFFFFPPLFRKAAPPTPTPRLVPKAPSRLNDASSSSESLGLQTLARWRRSRAAGRRPSRGVSGGRPFRAARAGGAPAA